MVRAMKMNMLIAIDGLTPAEAEAFIKDFRDLAQKYVDHTSGEIAFVAHIPEPARPDPNAN